MWSCGGVESPIYHFCLPLLGSKKWFQKLGRWMGGPLGCAVAWIIWLLTCPSIQQATPLLPIRL